MAIAKSVGRGGANRRSDVKFVQIVLNMNLGRLRASPAAFGTAAAVAASAAAETGPVGHGVAVAAAPTAAPTHVPLGEDGVSGPATVRRLEAFQREVGGSAQPTGRLDPGDALLGALQANVPAELTSDVLRAMLPNATAAHVARYRQALLDGMAANEITTPLRQAHFLAQLAHESGDFVHCEEIASGAAYEGRADLGNTQPGDGMRFKGRGLIQLTGRANYAAYGHARGRDFLTGDNPKRLATDAATAVDCACWYWTSRRLNALADRDDVIAVTKRINGGINGLADRRERLARAKYLLRVA